MARKVAWFGLVLLIALHGVGAADPNAGGLDSSIGNEGSGAAPAAATDAVEAPVGGPVPAGAFSNTVGRGFGPPAAQGSAAASSTFHHQSALLGAFGIGAIFFFTFS